MNAYAERALYVLKCAEKERDELIHRMEHSAQNDAIRITGASLLKSYAEKIHQAKANAEKAGAAISAVPAATSNAKETDRILRLPKK